MHLLSGFRLPFFPSHSLGNHLDLLGQSLISSCTFPSRQKDLKCPLFPFYAAGLTPFFPPPVFFFSRAHLFFPQIPTTFDLSSVAPAAGIFSPCSPKKELRDNESFRDPTCSQISELVSALCCFPPLDPLRNEVRRSVLGEGQFWTKLSLPDGSMRLYSVSLLTQRYNSDLVCRLLPRCTPPIPHLVPGFQRVLLNCGRVHIYRTCQSLSRSSPVRVPRLRASIFLFFHGPFEIEPLLFKSPPLKPSRSVSDVIFGSLLFGTTSNWSLPFFLPGASLSNYLLQDSSRPLPVSRGLFIDGFWVLFFFCLKNLSLKARE